MFKVSTASVCSTSGPIKFVLGQESNSLLLRPLTHIRNIELSSYLPSFATNLSLQASPLTPLLNIVGAVGGQESPQGRTLLYQTRMTPAGTFYFSVSPKSEDINSLNLQYYNQGLETIIPKDCSSLKKNYSGQTLPPPPRL